MNTWNCFMLCLALYFTSLHQDAVHHEYFSAQSSPPSSIKEEAQVNFNEFYACPRCRRAQPKGPRKRPVVIQENQLIALC